MKRTIRLKKQEQRHLLKKNIYLNQKRGKKLCILSHFDTEDIIADYVIFMLEEIYKLGFDIVFVSTSEKLTGYELEKISKYTFIQIVKKNLGYDFISWKVGLSFVGDYASYKKILHLNDSIFFPLNNANNMFDIMEDRNIDFWGLSDSYYVKYHIQSFFWCFESKIIISDFYENFWNNCEIIKDKNMIIKKYEVDFTSLVLANNYTVSSYIKISDVCDLVVEKLKTNYQKPLSSITGFYLYWDIFIQYFNAPFIKKNILLSNHEGFNPSTFMWKDIIQNYTGYDILKIENYLNSVDKKKINNKPVEQEFFFDDIDVITEVLQNLTKEEKKITLYGYGKFSSFVLASFYKNINIIIDEKKISIHQPICNLKESNCIEEVDQNSIEVIFITALGREAETMQKLQHCRIEKKCVDISSKLNKPPLLIANFFTRLARWIDVFEMLCSYRNYNVTFYSQNLNLNFLVKNYIDFFNIKGIKIQNTLQNKNKHNIDSILFKINCNKERFFVPFEI